MAKCNYCDRGQLHGESNFCNWCGRENPVRKTGMLPRLAIMVGALVYIYFLLQWGLK